MLSYKLGTSTSIFLLILKDQSLPKMVTKNKKLKLPHADKQALAKRAVHQRASGYQMLSDDRKEAD